MPREHDDSFNDNIKHTEMDNKRNDNPFKCCPTLREYNEAYLCVHILSPESTSCFLLDDRVGAKLDPLHSQSHVK